MECFPFFFTEVLSTVPCSYRAVQRLLHPAGKLSTYEQQEGYYRYREIPLHSLYRTLDHLYAHKETIESELFKEKSW